MTASRSGLASYFVIVGVVVAYRPSQGLRNRIPILVTTVTVCIAAAAIPFMDWKAPQFNYRPVLWWHALRLVQENGTVRYSV